MQLNFRQFKIKTFTNTGISLTPLELKDFIDWEVKRIYFVTDFIKDTGQHCHKEEKELFVCQRGVVTAVVDRGNGLEDLPMRGPEDAILVDNYVWHGFKDASADCVLLALSSTNYNPDRNDYITDYEEYKKICQKF
ncbi:MAG: FdtA/QdtA family cupin domain-containing protein [Candidatus Magasanikbacteria bacterium]